MIQQKYIQPYNIYFGTIGKKLGVKYRYTKNFRTSEDALEHAKNTAISFYYKNEGKYGLPSFGLISKESEITGVDIERLYLDHIEDMCRWYAIPTELDTISQKNIHY